jgi:hypothetical protein
LKPRLGCVDQADAPLLGAASRISQFSGAEMNESGFM